MERRALSRLALRPDPPAHELTQALADDQPQAGAAISAGRRGIDLAHVFEKSRISLMIVSRCWPLIRIVSAISRCSWSRRALAMRSDMPMIAFIGVRIS